MPWSTVYVLHPYIGATTDDGDTVITCMLNSYKLIIYHRTRVVCGSPHDDRIRYDITGIGSHRRRVHRNGSGTPWNQSVTPSEPHYGATAILR